MLDRLTRKIYYILYIRLIGSYFSASGWLRAVLLRKMTANTSADLVVRPGVYISGYRNLVIGSRVSINHNCFLSCEGGLTIGDDVAIAHGVSILTTEHGYADSIVPIKFQPLSFHSVSIGNDVWIGAKATILAGVTLADGTIVAAGAVVKNSVTVKNTIVGGVPAKYIKARFPD